MKRRVATTTTTLAESALNKRMHYGGERSDD